MQLLFGSREVPLRSVIDRDCTHNALRGLATRVVSSLPEVDLPTITRLKKVFKPLARLVRARRGPTWTHQEYVDHYSGAKRAMYQRALDNLSMTGMRGVYARMKAFVKADKVDITTAKPCPDPRIIQGRWPEFNILLGSLLKPIEDVVYSLKLPRWGLRTPIFGKRHDSWHRGKWVDRKYRSFKNPVVLGLDCSRFDKHVNSFQLLREHEFYLGCALTPEERNEMKRLLRYQERNYGSMRSGITYDCEGRRMSGDVNTALGNCLLMFAMTFAAMHKLGIHWDLYIDGDDTLVFCEAKDLSRVRAALLAEFTACGHKLRVDSIARNMHEVRWCQCAPVRVGGRWRMVRDPGRVLLHDLMQPKFFQTAKSRAGYLGTVGEAELILNSGVPVLASLAKCFVRAAAGHRLALESLPELLYKVRLEKVFNASVDYQARADFADAWGVPVEAQLALEHYFDGWQLKPLAEPVWLRPDWQWPP